MPMARRLAVLLCLLPACAITDGGSGDGCAWAPALWSCLAPAGVVARSREAQTLSLRGGFGADARAAQEAALQRAEEVLAAHSQRASQDGPVGVEGPSSADCSGHDEPAAPAGAPMLLPRGIKWCDFSARVRAGARDRAHFMH